MGGGRHYCVTMQLTRVHSGVCSFVIKTADTKDGAKVFINICASDKVPAPGNWKTGQMPEEASSRRRKNISNTQ